MYYHLILTDECNLNCTYCRGKDYFSDGAGFESGSSFIQLPPSPEYSREELYSFLKKDEAPVVLFYGGEPLLRPDLIMDFMDNMPWCGFSLYTNGLMLRDLSCEYIRKLKTVIISIDGDMETTDGYRGCGVYNRVMNNIGYLYESGFSGEIIGRITVAENTDIFKSVTHLAANGAHSFSSIHWQMDANFWYDYSNRPDFGDWIERSYNPGIFRLADHWVDMIKRTGKVPRWYPFCGLIYDILTGSVSTPVRCGAGYMNYAVQTDGNIVPCPCMQGMEEYYCGNIFDSSPSSLKRIEPSGDCSSCGIYDFCGGRCLYSNIIQPWPEEGRKLVYGSVLNLKSAMESIIPEIRKMMAQGSVSADDFRIDKYNGCEIIP